MGSRQQDVLNVVVDEMKSPNGTFVEFSSIRDIPIEFSAKFGLLRQEFEARLGHELGSFIVFSFVVHQRSPSHQTSLERSQFQRGIEGYHLPSRSATRF